MHCKYLGPSNICVCGIIVKWKLGELFPFAAFVIEQRFLTQSGEDPKTREL